MKNKKIALALSAISLTGGILFSSSVFANTSGTWKMENNSWKYYKEDGSIAKSWIKLDKDWYYLDFTSGIMQTSWLDYKGERYFLNTISDGTKGKMLTGWHWIDGYCYYFDESKGVTEGKLLKSTKTPDGYLVNEKGQWINEKGEVVYKKGKGINTLVNYSASRKVASGSFGGASSSFSSGASTSVSFNTEVTEKEENELLNRQYTKLVDLGFIEYLTVNFKEGNLEDYKVSVNGFDISDDLTKVDDEGTLVKWATSIVSPKKLEVVRISDGKVDKLEFANATNEVSPIKKTKNTVPKYMLTNGPISAFDYHLDNYDENGEVRIYPTKTTFNFSNDESKNIKDLPSAYYVKDVELNTEGNGQIEIKLSLDKDSEKWFNELNEVKILDREHRVLNVRPNYIKSIDTTYGNTGVVRINVPQLNLSSAGRYFINLASSYSDAKYTVPVHVIRGTQFVLEQSTETPDPELGNADVLFEIVSKSGETFGTEILNPIYRVELKFPNGETKELENIKDYSLIGNIFHIYESYKDKDETDILIDQAGIYEVTIYANGYKTMKKKFAIGQSDAPALQGLEDDEVDIVSMATGGGAISVGDSSSSTGTGSAGGYNINANLLFDYDLLANALVLNKLGKATAYSEQVVKVFFARQVPEIVFADDFGTGYSQRDFLNVVKDARLEENKTISFAEYISSSPVIKFVPSKIKRVLEDGKLGPVETIRDSVGERVGEVVGTTVTANKDFILRFSEADYVEKIKNIYLDDRGTALRSDSYLKEYEIKDNTLVIFASTLRNIFGNPYIGKHKLEIEADSYQKKTITLTVKPIEEKFDLTLLTENPRIDIPIKIKTSSDDENTKGSFLKEFIGIISVDEKNKERAIYKVGVASFKEGYKIEDGNIVIEAGTFSKAGRYTLIFSANGYPSKNIVVDIAAASDVVNEDNTGGAGTGSGESTGEAGAENGTGTGSGESTGEAGAENGASTGDGASAGENTTDKEPFVPVSKKSSLLGNVSLIYEDSKDVSAYLDLLTKGKATLKINNEVYTHKTYIFGSTTNDFKVSRGETGSSSNLAIIEYNKGSLPEKYIVEIVAEGYKDIRFEVSKDTIKAISDKTDDSKEGTDEESSTISGGESSGENTQDKKEGFVPTSKKDSFLGDVSLTFEDKKEVNDYLTLLKNGTATLKINGENYTYKSYLIGDNKNFRVLGTESGASGNLARIEYKKGMLPEVYEIEIVAEGYKDIRFEVSRDGVRVISDVASDDEGVENGDESTKITPPAVVSREESNSLLESLIILNFADNIDTDTYLKLLRSGEATLKVNGEVWNNSSYLSSPKQYMVFKDAGGYTGYYSKIKFEKNSFRDLSDTVIVSIEASAYNTLNYNLQVR